MKRVIFRLAILLFTCLIGFVVFSATGLFSAVKSISGTAPVINQSHSEIGDKTPNLQDPRILIVKIYSDGMLAINNSKISGKDELRERLSEIFEARVQNGIFSDSMINRNDLPDNERIEKTVWILAASKSKPETIDAVLKAVKQSGAAPIKMLTAPRYQKLLNVPPTTPQPLI